MVSLSGSGLLDPVETLSCKQRDTYLKQVLFFPPAPTQGYSTVKILLSGHSPLREERHMETNVIDFLHCFPAVFFFTHETWGERDGEWPATKSPWSASWGHQGSPIFKVLNRYTWSLPSASRGRRTRLANKSLFPLNIIHGVWVLRLLSTLILRD